MHLLYPPIFSQRTSTTSGTSCATLFEWCVGSLTSHIELMNVEGICEMGPAVYSPYPRRLESLTTCSCNYKGITFSSVILRPWVLVQLESNSRPLPYQPGAQPTEPLVHGIIFLYFRLHVCFLFSLCFIYNIAIIVT